MSAKVYKLFPDTDKKPPPPGNAKVLNNGNKYSKLKVSISPRVTYAAWLVLSLLWPIIRWIFAFDILYQFLSGGHALLHFGIFVALTYFVEFYGPSKF